MTRRADPPINAAPVRAMTSATKVTSIEFEPVCGSDSASTATDVGLLTTASALTAIDVVV